VLVRSLWVRISAPVGIPLRREQAPALFETARRLSRSLRAPRVHEVVLDGSFNASVVQIPRLGVLGWSRNYLTVGLPLLDALTPEQFVAVLAHEFGHLAGAHGRFRAWIYRLRTSWAQLPENLKKQKHRGWFLFAKFFAWYGPVFNAYTLVLARAQEYSADHHSAEVVGPMIAADALTAVAVGARGVTTKFWPSLLRTADTQPSPPSQPFTELERNLGGGFLDDEAKKALEAILAQKPSPSDTHPPLRDRLASLGEKARLPGPIKKSAAEQFVGNALVDLREALNRRWESEVTAPWKARYNQARASREKLLQLTEKSKVEKLSTQEMWQIAALTEAIHGADAAVPLYQQILLENEDHAAANFAVGRILLSRDDFNGVPMLEQAMELNSDFVPVGCALIQGFLWQHDREDDAEVVYRRAREHERIVALAGLERRRIHRRDRFIETGLDHATIAPIREELSKYPEVARAYLVRKEVIYSLKSSSSSLVSFRGFERRSAFACGPHRDLPSAWRAK
jgi:Zn-dependent protease with chaperone function